MPHRSPLILQRGRLALASSVFGIAGSCQAQAVPEPWTVAGRQGVILQVIVPEAQAKDRTAYQRQIESLCAGKETCFVNFYTNTTGVPLAIPLPDEVSHQATAVLRRSAKQGTEGFRWSCRLGLPEPDCF